MIQHVYDLWPDSIKILSNSNYSCRNEFTKIVRTNRDQSKRVGYCNTLHWKHDWEERKEECSTCLRLAHQFQCSINVYAIHLVYCLLSLFSTISLYYIYVNVDYLVLLSLTCYHYRSIHIFSYILMHIKIKLNNFMTFHNCFLSEEDLEYEYIVLHISFPCC